MPVWSPRGDEIAYSFDEHVAQPVTLRKRLGQSPQLMASLPEGQVTPTDWSPDGRYLAVNRVTGSLDVVVWSIDEKKWIEVATAPVREMAAVFSGDGKWIAYQSSESGINEIYVQPFPPTGAKYQVSAAGGSTPRWLGNEISYVDARSHLTVVSVSTAPQFRASTPQTLFLVDLGLAFGAPHDAFPDGNFLVNEPVPQARPMTLLVNWTRRLEKAK